MQASHHHRAPRPAHLNQAAAVARERPSRPRPDRASAGMDGRDRVAAFLRDTPGSRAPIRSGEVLHVSADQRCPVGSRELPRPVGDEGGLVGECHRTRNSIDRDDAIHTTELSTSRSRRCAVRCTGAARYVCLSAGIGLGATRSGALWSAVTLSRNAASCAVSRSNAASYASRTTSGGCRPER